MKSFWCLFILIFALNSCKKEDNLKLEKIVFNTDDSGCWGLCPMYHLEINENRIARLHVEKFLYYDSTCYKTKFEYCEPKSDSSKIGYFEGKINPKEFIQIKSFIERNRFDTIQNNSAKTNCKDGLHEKYILYFNQNIRKEIVYNCIENPQLDSLSKMLFQIIDKNQLKRTDKSFYLENIDL